MVQKKTYLITGASSGIGFETALFLAENPNMQVIATARNIDKLKDLHEKSGKSIICIPFDLHGGDPQNFRKELIESRIERIDGIVHNAGLLVNRAFEDISRNELEMSYQTNVFAPYFLTQALLPLLKSSDSAHIIHISSMGGVQGSVKFPGLSAYSSSKGALSVLTECLALELTPHNIRVNCLALGAVQTEMLGQAFPGYTAPLKAHEMGSFIAWFLENGHRFFNGKILPVALSTP